MLTVARYNYPLRDIFKINFNIKRKELYYFLGLCGKQQLSLYQSIVFYNQAFLGTFEEVKQGPSQITKQCISELLATCYYVRQSKLNVKNPSNTSFKGCNQGVCEVRKHTPELLILSAGIYIY